MMQRNLILIPIAILAFCCAAVLSAAAAPGRYLITTELIAAAITNHGIPVSPDQIALLTNVYASIIDPQLSVVSVDRTSSDRVMVRLECATADQCLPFIVTLRSGAELSAGATRTAAVVKTQPAVAIVHSGTATTLLLDGQHVHITLPVICTQNGAAGQTIRATSPDRRQTYVAQVANDGTLKGRL